MNKIIWLIAMLGMSIAISSCKKASVVRCSEKIITNQSLQGLWNQNHKSHEPSTSQPDNYLNMTFSNDSFRLAVEHYSDIMKVDGCNEVIWQEYAKETYKLDNGYLYFSGIYCEHDYTEKTSGCYNIGAFKDTFRVSLCNDTLKMYALSNNKQNYPEIYRTVNMLKE